MTGLILHITNSAAWDEARMIGLYRAASLDSEGFIHCSGPEQVLTVANNFYRGQTGLLLLMIDPARLSAPLKYEPPAHPTGHSEQPDPEVEEALFPHLYGPLNVDAVVRVLDFPPRPDGTFALPE